MWTKVLGWILIFVGVLWLFFVLGMLIHDYQTDGGVNVELLSIIVVLVAFIWGGWKLARRKGWNKALGWVLFTTGTLVSVLVLTNHWLEVIRVSPMLIFSAIPILFIWGGWKLAHRS